MRFTDSHEWIRVEEGIGTVGITDHAQKELGEVVYIERPSVGKHVQAGDEIAVLESTKAAADIYSPVSGEIIDINQKLGDFIHHINASAEKEGWLFKIKLSDLAETDKLLTREAYLNLVQ
jgi:glycine cleavage system H protein